MLDAINKVNGHCSESNKLRASVQIMVLSAFVALSAALISPAFAQDELEGLPVKLGDTNLYPSVSLSFLQNSNSLLSNSNEVSSTATVIAPTVRWVADRRLASITASYAGNYQASSETALNYDDHQFVLEAGASYTKRQLLSGSLRIGFGHEELGFNLTRGIATLNDEQVEHSDIELAGQFTYGAEQARGNVSVGARVQAFSYSNRPDLTRGGDFNLFEPYAQFSLRISSDTRAIAEVRYGSVAFDNSDSDYDFITVLGGLSFAATGKLGGEVKVGSSTSQFKLAGADDSTTLVFEADLSYTPSTLTKFTLSADRAFENANGSTSDQVIYDVVALSWGYRQSERVFYAASVQRESRTRTCPEVDTATVSGFASVKINVRRWIAIGIGASSATRSSGQCANSEIDDSDLDFDRQKLNVFTEITL